jgi:hypothetical protein
VHGDHLGRAVAAEVVEATEVGRGVVCAHRRGQQRLAGVVDGGEGDHEILGQQASRGADADPGGRHLHGHLRRQRGEAAAARDERVLVVAPGLQVDLPRAQLEGPGAQEGEVVVRARLAGPFEQHGVGGDAVEDAERQPALPRDRIGAVEVEAQGMGGHGHLRGRGQNRLS